MNLSPRTKLVRFSPNDFWTVNNSFEGVQIFGKSGSGKTSGSGKVIARALLEAGYGFLVMCAKVDEANHWRQLCHETGRTNELLVFGDNEHCFNFLNYELSRGGTVSITNAVALFERIIEASRVANPTGGGGGDNQFWNDATRELLTYSIMALYAAYGFVQVEDILRLASSAPAKGEFKEKSWQENSYYFQTMNVIHTRPKNPLEPHDFKVIDHYFVENFGPGGKTRQNVMMSLSAALTPFRTGRLRRLFSTNTTVVPEMTHSGMIIVLDMPLHDWHAEGVIAQQLFKYCWQRATERRTGDALKRPVCLYADESHFFINSYDAEFLSTARSVRACNVYLTQSYQAYVNQLKFLANAQAATDSILNNMSLKIFHLLDDANTRQYGSDLIGTSYQIRHNTGRTSGQSVTTGTTTGKSDGTSWSYNMDQSTFGMNCGKTHGTSNSAATNNGTSEGTTEVVEPEVRPDRFGRNLRTGGPDHDMIVDGIVYTAGLPWRYSRRNWLKVRFSQT